MGRGFSGLESCQAARDPLGVNVQYIHLFAFLLQRNRGWKKRGGREEGEIYERARPGEGEERKGGREGKGNKSNFLKWLNE